MTDTNMNSAAPIQSPIARLRASKQKFEEGNADYGKAAGRKWAETKAEYEELANLERLVGTEYGFRAFRDVVDSNGDLDGDELAKWLGLTEEDFTNDLVVISFVQGASEFFNEIEAAL